jgi:endonuclease/exonuclease/phosphatase family metal-dependent hydrolase
MRIVKISTLNLQGFVNWSTHKPAVLDYFKNQQPDIIFFQEVVYLPQISPYNQVQELNQDLHYLFEQSSVTRLQKSPDYDVFREGLAVISKHPIVKSDVIVLKQEEGDQHNRIIQLVDLFIDGKTVKCANIHFSLTEVADFATLHFKETLEILKSKGEKRIIAGDFNMVDLQACAALWADDYTASSITPYISFPSENKTIDYILIPKENTFGSISATPNALTDHCAVTAEISFS